MLNIRNFETINEGGCLALACIALNGRIFV